MSMKRVRKRYGVPAQRGGRVEYTGEGRSEFGTITSARNDRLHIRMDGWKFSLPFHPTWKLRYLETETSGEARNG